MAKERRLGEPMEIGDTMAIDGKLIICVPMGPHDTCANCCLFLNGCTDGPICMAQVRADGREVMFKLK